MEKGAAVFRNCLETLLPDYDKEKMPLQILGPVPCIYGKINNKYRWRMILKCRNNDLFRQFLREVIALAEKQKEIKKIHIYVDMNGNTGI